jgi:hypothetical protein
VTKRKYAVTFFHTCLAASLCILPGMTLAEQLPPQEERAAELIAVITSEAVMSGLNDAPIISVESLTSQAYRVQSESCTVVVKIVDDLTPTPRVGPRQFDVMVTGVTCR